MTRVLDAGDRLLVERLELLRTEVRGDVTRALAGSGLAMGGGILLLTGWGVLMAALVVGLAAVMPTGAALAVVGGFHFVVGAGLLWGASARIGKTPGRLQAPPPPETALTRLPGPGAIPPGAPPLSEERAHGADVRKAAG